MKNVLVKLNKLRNEIEREASKREFISQKSMVLEDSKTRSEYEEKSNQLEDTFDNIGTTISRLLKYLRDK